MRSLHPGYSSECTGWRCWGSVSGASSVALAGGLVGSRPRGTSGSPHCSSRPPSPAAAGGANIAVSGLAAAAASITHRRGHGASIGASSPGCCLPPWPGPLAGGLAAVAHPSRRAQDRHRHGAHRLRRRPPPPAAGRAGASRPAQHPRRGDRSSGDRRARGLNRAHLGSLRLPALIPCVGEEPASASGRKRTLVVGIAVRRGRPSATSARRHRLDAPVGVGAAGSIPGALLGARLTRPALAAPAAARGRRNPRRRRHGGDPPGRALVVLWRAKNP